MHLLIRLLNISSVCPGNAHSRSFECATHKEEHTLDANAFQRKRFVTWRHQINPLMLNIHTFEI